MYKEYIEKGFRMTIPQDVLVYYVEEVENKYIAVLMYYDKDEAKNIYYPFEADIYTGQFGRGAGQVLDNIINVEFWINKYDKTYRTGKDLARIMGNEIVKKIKDEMEFSKAKGGDEEKKEEPNSSGDRR
jgi:hypothetical protein